MVRTLSLWLPVAAWCALIFTLSSIPNLSSGLQYDFALRKLGHMLEYGVLFALMRRALSGSGVSLAAASWSAAAFCLLYAASDVSRQSFVPGRRGGLSDVAVDSVGVLAWWALSSRAGAVNVKRG
mgnify:CR=1 FL=1